MKRLSITEAPAFANKFPTRGMKNCLKFGTDFWLSLHDMRLPISNLIIHPRCEDDEMETHTHSSLTAYMCGEPGWKRGWLQEAKECQRLTMFCSFEDLKLTEHDPITFTMMPQIKIQGFMQGQKKESCSFTLQAFFTHEGALLWIW